jgi:predicted DNA-binding antitoxin AbrB/MazE fold protein
MEIPAIYENGVFRPLEPVVLPEKTPVTVVPDIVPNEKIGSASDELYAILAERSESGFTDTAARVDELDP